MAKKSKRSLWTTDHVSTLKALAQEKTRAASIAKTLKRSEGATTVDRRELPEDPNVQIIRELDCCSA
jgi:hypothetical protein